MMPALHVFAPQATELAAPAAEMAVPCPLTQLTQWHQHQAQYHRTHLPAEPADEAEGGALVTARTAWHRGWAEWHEQQAQMPAATY